MLVTSPCMLRLLRKYDEEITVNKVQYIEQFVRTLRRDLRAVGLSIEMPWSSGVHAGRISPLKVINRQPVQGLDLLRKKICAQ